MGGFVDFKPEEIAVRLDLAWCIHKEKKKFLTIFKYFSASVFCSKLVFVFSQWFSEKFLLAEQMKPNKNVFSLFFSNCSLSKAVMDGILGLCRGAGDDYSFANRWNVAWMSGKKAGWLKVGDEGEIERTWDEKMELFT